MVDRLPAAPADSATPAAAPRAAHQMGLFGEEAAAPASPRPTASRPTPPSSTAQRRCKTSQQKLKAADQIVVDVESTSPESMQAGLVGIALALPDETTYYVPSPTTARSN